MSRAIEFMADTLDGSRVNLENLFRYANDAVFVDKFRTDLYETDESIQNWKVLESDFLEAVGIDGSVEDRIELYIQMNRPIFTSYEEKNNYVISQLEKLERSDIDSLYEGFSALHFRLLPNFELVGEANRFTLEPEVSRTFIENIRLEEGYMREKFNVEYFKNSEIYINLTTFFIITSACLRTVNSLYKSRIDITVKEAQILNNLLVSQGFLNFNVVPINLKSALLINLVKLYRTKGTLESIQTISRIFGTRGDMEISYLYLYFDRIRWEEDDKPENKTGYYKFFKVSTDKGTITPDVDFVRSSESGDVLSYDEVVSGDNTWRATENELYDSGVRFVKTKYIYIDQKTDLSSLSLELPILSEMLAYFYETKKGDLAPQLRSVYEHIRFLDYAIIKRSNPKDVIDLDSLTLKNINENDYQRLLPSQKVLDRLDRIVNPTVFIREFEQAYNTFVTEVKAVANETVVVRETKSWLEARSKYNNDIIRGNYSSYSYMKSKNFSKYLEDVDEGKYLAYRNDEELDTVSIDNYMNAYEHLWFELRSINIGIDFDAGQMAANQVFIYLLGYFSAFYAKFIGAQSSYLLEDKVFSLAVADLLDTTTSVAIREDKGNVWDTYGFITFKNYEDILKLFDKLLNVIGVNNKRDDLLVWDKRGKVTGEMIYWDYWCDYTLLYKGAEDVLPDDIHYTDQPPYIPEYYSTKNCFILKDRLMDIFTEIILSSNIRLYDLINKTYGKVNLEDLSSIDLVDVIDKAIGTMLVIENDFELKYKREVDLLGTEPIYTDKPPFFPPYIFYLNPLVNDKLGEIFTNTILSDKIHLLDRLSSILNIVGTKHDYSPVWDQLHSLVVDTVFEELGKDYRKRILWDLNNEITSRLLLDTNVNLVDFISDVVGNLSETDRLMLRDSKEFSGLLQLVERRKTCGIPPFLPSYNTCIDYLLYDDMGSTSGEMLRIDPLSLDDTTSILGSQQCLGDVLSIYDRTYTQHTMLAVEDRRIKYRYKSEVDVLPNDLHYEEQGPFMPHFNFEMRLIADGYDIIKVA